MIAASEVAAALGHLLSALPLSDYRTATASWADAGRVVTMTVSVTVTDDDEVEQ